jgi:hypothetical protein
MSYGHGPFPFEDARGVKVKVYCQVFMHFAAAILLPRGVQAICLNS